MAHNEYLHKEYELCFEQLRYYDTRHSDTLKYLFTLSSSAAAALFALYKFFQQSPKEFYIFQSLLTTIVFLSSLILFLSMVRNRLYFVFVARQLNAIRKFLMENEAKEFKNNQLYTTSNIATLNIFSLHTLQLIGAAIISCIFAAATTYGVYPAHDLPPCVSASVLSFILVFVAELIGGGLYLYISGKKSSDTAINKDVSDVKPEPSA